MPAPDASFAAAAEPAAAEVSGSSLRRWRVLLPLPLDGAYDYLAEVGQRVVLGSYVAAPLGKRVVPGVVWGPGGEDGIAEEKLKPIAAVLDVPPMPAELR